MLGMLFGQIPTSVTVCLCTGEVSSSLVKETELCVKHELPKCDHCKSKARKGCFVTRATSNPITGTAQHFEAPEFAAILPPPFEVIVAAWQPILSPRPCMVLPRIREPDLSGHQLRAPPSLV